MIDDILSNADIVGVWIGGGDTDEFGNNTTYTKTALACNVQETSKKIINAKGKEIIPEYVIRCETQISIDALIDLENNTDFSRQNCYEVQAVKKVKDVDGTSKWWKIWV